MPNLFRHPIKKVAICRAALVIHGVEVAREVLKQVQHDVLFYFPWIFIRTSAHLHIRTSAH